MTQAGREIFCSEHHKVTHSTRNKEEWPQRTYLYNATTLTPNIIERHNYNYKTGIITIIRQA